MSSVGSWIRSITGNNDPLFFILGPCAIESEKHAMNMAEQLVLLAEKLQFHLIFKSSLDKANRTSLSSYRGIGFEKGLRVLEKIRATFHVPIITDVHEQGQVESVAAVVDVIQIPAFLSRQTDLLLAAGKTGKPVFVKKAQFVAPETMKRVIEKVESTGNKNTWLGERGFTFGYNNLVVDFRNFPIMKKIGKPVIFDVTHAVQQPGGLGNASGGDRRFVPNLAAAAVVQGIAGIFMEVHDQPEKALCDGPNMVRLSRLPDLLKHLIDLDAWIKKHPIPEMQ